MPPVGTYTTATQLEALKLTPRPRTFLRERLFGGRSTTFETQYVIFDVTKNKRALAPFVNKHIGGFLVEKSHMNTQRYEPPQITPRSTFNGSEAFERMPGEVIGGSESPDDRAAALRAKILSEHDVAITRTEEVMCAQMLSTGVIPIVGEGVSDEIDLGFTNTDTLSGTSRWGQSASNVLANIRGWKNTNIKKSGVSSDTMVCGEGAADALLNDEGFLKAMDKRYAKFGQVDVADLPSGAVYIGTVLGVDIYEYPEWYINPTNGVETPLIPTDKIVLFPSAARNIGAEMLYAAYYDVEDKTTYVGERIPRAWTDKASNQEFIEVVCLPVPKMPDVDSWLVATVV